MYKTKPSSYYPKSYDVVQRIKAFNGAMHLLGELAVVGVLQLDEFGEPWRPNDKQLYIWKVLETLPGTQAKVGDFCIVINDDDNVEYSSKVSTVFKCTGHNYINDLLHTDNTTLGKVRTNDVKVLVRN